MSTKSRQTIYGGPIMGAKIRADGARKRAAEAAREADRAEAEAWSLQMEAYGGPAQPSPTMGQCLRPPVGADRNRMAAVIVAAIDQDASNAHRAHFTQGYFLRAAHWT